jgi:hypothetical protein
MLRRTLELTDHRNASLLTDPQVKRLLVYTVIIIGGFLAGNAGLPHWSFSIPLVGIAAGVAYLATRTRFIACDRVGVTLRLNPWWTQSISWKEIHAVTVMPNDVRIQASNDRDYMVEIYGTPSESRAAFIEGVEEFARNANIAVEILQ